MIKEKKRKHTIHKIKNEKKINMRRKDIKCDKKIIFLFRNRRLFFFIVEAVR